MATAKLRNLSKFNASDSVYVGSLAWITGAPQLKQYMETFGKVTRIFFFTDNYRGVHLGSALVKFADKESAEKVVLQKDHIIDNKAVNIKVHSPAIGGSFSENAKKGQEEET